MNKYNLLSGEILYEYNLINKHNYKKRAGTATAYYQLDLQSADLHSNLMRLSTLYNEGAPFVIFGDHTNLYITENGYNGLFIDIKAYKNESITYNESSHTFCVGADCVLDYFVHFAAELGYDFTGLVAIPGLIGSAISGNSGSKGVEIGNFVNSIKIFNFAEKKYETLYPNNKFFSRRNSHIGKSNETRFEFLIVSCILKADYIGTNEAQKKLEQKLKERKQTDELSNQYGTAGSFWVSSSAPSQFLKTGKKVRDLIVDLGLSKISYNGARFVTKKCFLATEKHTTDKDVAFLLDLTIKKLKEEYGFVPVKEVIILDYDGKITIDEFIKRYL